MQIEDDQIADPGKMPVEESHQKQAEENSINPGFSQMRWNRRKTQQYPWEKRQNKTWIPGTKQNRTQNFPWIQFNRTYVPDDSKWHMDKVEILPWNPNKEDVFLDPYVGHRRGRKLPWSRKSLNLKQIDSESWSKWIWDLFEMPSALIKNLVAPWECNDTFVKSNGTSRKFYQLWPSGFNEQNDRILNQLAVTINDLRYFTGNVTKQSVEPRLKRIAVYGSVKPGQQEFINGQL